MGTNDENTFMKVVNDDRITGVIGTLAAIRMRHGSAAVSSLLSFINAVIDDASDEEVHDDALRALRIGTVLVKLEFILNDDGTVTFAYDRLRCLPDGSGWTYV